MKQFRTVLAFLGVIGLTACKMNVSDAAFCGPAFSGAVDRLGSEALAAQSVPEPLGNAVADVVTGHKAGCAK